jgi:hypothetical protein
MSTFNGPFWANYFKNVFKKNINDFREAVINRLLPTFEKIEAEAEDITIKEWENPTTYLDPDFFDEADLAARADDMGLSHLLTQLAIKQTLLNLSISALYHIFEQQLLLFHRREVLQLGQENDVKLITISKLKNILSKNKIHIEHFSTWSKLEELRDAANAIKHAEGQSAEKLRVLRPDVFTHPSTLILTDSELMSGKSVFMPLAGEDLFFTNDDIENYCNCILSFWDELGEALKECSRNSI